LGHLSTSPHFLNFYSVLSIQATHIGPKSITFDNDKKILANTPHILDFKLICYSLVNVFSVQAMKSIYFVSD
jgi:hypothetical protein